MIARRSLCLAIAVACATGVTLLAFQNSKSATAAKQLAQALEAAKLDSIAAADPSDPSVFVAALYIPGSQLLVVSAKYAAPSLLTAKIKSKEYRDVYIDLNSASVPQSKIFISDLGANGLQARRRGNQPADTVDTKGKSYALDGDWGKAKISEDEYMRTYQESDSEYAKMLEALIAELKR